MLPAKLFSLWLATLKFRNFHYYILDSLGLIKNEYALHLRNGLTLRVRPKRNREVADIDIIREVILHDEYDLESIGQNDVVVDVGAQIGSFALMAADRARCVYAFEPVPHNYSQLEKNVAASRLDNVKIFDKAVTATDGKTTIFLSADNEGAHSIYDERGNPSVEVGTISLENIVKRYGQISLLKLDCEGSEYPIILDTSRECFKHIDKIILELHYTPQIKRQYGKHDVIDSLKSHGFSVVVESEVHYPDEGWFRIVRATRQTLN